MVNGIEMLEDGTHIELDLKSTNLDSAKVYCVVDHPGHNVYLWIGRNSNVRLRFVGAQIASNVRSDVGLHYKVRSIDDGAEPAGFFQVLENSVSDKIPSHSHS